MELARYARGDASPCVVVREAGEAWLVEGIDGVGDLLRRPLEEIRARCDQAVGAGLPVEGRLLPPVDGHMEVWAAGVTYLRSREARAEESTEASVYERVYDAERPELFFKSVAWKVVGAGDVIAIRQDSPLNVPEPEVAVVANAAGEIVGLTVCNDVSSRSIEGENPLYLPQAKVYRRSCAIGPAIRPLWDLGGTDDLAIRLVVRRGTDVAYEGETSTNRLKRTFESLVEWLYAENEFPEGVVLSTGTGIVPEMSFTLAEGDNVEIHVESVGTLSNVVGFNAAPAAGS